MALARAISRVTTPIFMAMGLWDEVVDSNENAVRRAQGVAAPNRPPTACGHYSTWLHYGYLRSKSSATDGGSVVPR